MSYIERFIRSFFVAIFLLSTITPVRAQQTTFTYDDRGNLTSSGTECFEYNSRNLPSLVKECATEQLIEKYSYRPDRQRFKVERFDDGIHVETIYNFDDFIEVKVDETSGLEETSYYVYGNGTLVGKILSDGNKHFYHTDHLGSVVLITDESGNQVDDRTIYGPFGNLVTVGQSTSAYGYTGQEADSIGFNWYNSRTYDPQVGMFAQPDSIRPSVRPTDLNPYAYVQNNPLVYTDPSGNFLEAFSEMWDQRIQPLLDGALEFSGHILDVAASHFSNSGADKVAQNLEIAGGVADGLDLYQDLSNVADVVLQDESVYLSYKEANTFYEDEKPSVADVEEVLANDFFIDKAKQKSARDLSYGVLTLFGDVWSIFVDPPITSHNDPEFQLWLHEHWSEIHEPGRHPMLKKQLSKTLSED